MRFSSFLPILGSLLVFPGSGCSSYATKSAGETGRAYRDHPAPLNADPSDAAAYDNPENGVVAASDVLSAAVRPWMPTIGSNRNSPLPKLCAVEGMCYLQDAKGVSLPCPELILRFQDSKGEEIANAKTSGDGAFRVWLPEGGRYEAYLRSERYDLRTDPKGPFSAGTRLTVYIRWRR